MHDCDKISRTGGQLYALSTARIWGDSLKRFQSYGSLNCRGSGYPQISGIAVSVTGRLGNRVVSVLDSGAEGPGFESQLSGNSLGQTVHAHRASVHQAAKLVAALLKSKGNCGSGGK